MQSIFEKGNTADPGNYSPVFLLNLTSKVYKGILPTVLDRHNDSHNLSNPNHWDFKKGTSTESLLLYQTETWKAALDAKRVVGVIFIDFRKARSHRKEPQDFKLQIARSGNLQGLHRLLLSYLENRVQYVEINRKRSRLRFVKTGVPQGSNLAPQLFAIYVINFSEANKIGELYMFVDDTTILIRIRRYCCRYLGKSC